MMLEYPKVSNNPTVEDYLDQFVHIQAKKFDHLLHAQKLVIMYDY